MDDTDDTNVVQLYDSRMARFFADVLPNADTPERSGSRPDYSLDNSALKSLFGKVRDLNSILHEIICPEFGDSPSRRAFDESIKVLVAACELVFTYSMVANESGGFTFPSGDVCITENQGVKIEWNREGQCVRLYIDNENPQRDYIYFEFDEVFDWRKVTAKELATLLNSL